MAKRGISLLDLLAPAGAQALLPDDVAAKLEDLAVVEHRSTTTPGAFVHEGVVQPLSDLGLPALRGWPVEMPGLNTGLPFRLVRVRSPLQAGDTLEPAAVGSYLDLVLDRVAVTVPGLKPATLVTATGSPAHLVPDTTRSAVKIVGSGVLRIDLTGTTSLVRFVDFPDPFDPAAPNGPVHRLTFEPAAFTFGSSDFGMVVDRVLYDASEEVTPPEILARGQTPGWQGMAIAEATLLIPAKGTALDQVNVSVKDVLLGSPAGLQGEVQVELGRTPISGAAVQFTQDVDGTEHPRTPAGSGRELTVPFVPSTPETGRMRSRLSDAVLGQPTQPRISWTLPDGSRVADSDSGWFVADVGDRVEGVYSELADGERVSDLPVAYTFTQEDDLQHGPFLDLEAHSINNVVSLSGSREALNLVSLAARVDVTDGDDIRWQLGTGADAHTRRGADFVLFPGDVGTHWLVVTDGDGRARRIRIDVLAEGPLLVGAEDGVHDAFGNLVDVRGVESTLDLRRFHRSGELAAGTDPAVLDGAGGVSVPDGALAAVTVGLGSGTDPGGAPPAVTESEVRHLSVSFAFNGADPEGWGQYAPHNPSGSIASSIQGWAAFFPGARFLVIGHCCDIGTDPRNGTLARSRIASVTPYLPPGQVDARGEQEAATGTVATTQLAATELSATERLAGRTITLDFTAAERLGWEDVRDHTVRERYRRVDIYAVGGTYTPPSGAPAQGEQAPVDGQRTDAGLRRSYVPGADKDEVDEPGSPHTRTGYLVRLRVAWDSPTVTDPADAVPTLAEVTVAWSSQHVTMTDEEGNEVDVPVSSPSDPTGTPSTEIYTIVGRWDHDNRSGQTRFSMSITSEGDPAGLVRLESSFLAVALALAPALLGGIGGDVTGGVVRMSALAIASAVMAAITTEGWVVVHGAEVEYAAPSIASARNSRVRVTVDYTAAIGIAISASGLGSIATAAGSPLKVRYRKVGIEYDDSGAEWYDKVGFVFEDVSFEVADPGRWQLDGPLGDLLAITATRAGSGSTWFECDLEFALDLGVVTIQGATVRVVFADDGSITAELRGLALAVEIPGVLLGSGQVVLGDGGAFGASLELELVSVGAKGMGALEFDPASDYLSIQLGLLLPVGIPLGATGLGIFGFLGMFVSNGARQLPPGFDDDPVGREIAWYRDAPLLDKFGPERGQWAIGLGMIVGTMPDQAFTFNATGMLVVAFPDPAVVFGIDAKLASKPDLVPKAQGAAPGAGLEILGLVVVDDEAVMVGVRGRYAIPKLLTLTVPVDGYFPYPATVGDAFVRVGSDGVVAEGRGGDPVQIVLLPDTLDIEASAFLMVEEKQLHKLGGDDRFNFDGFSVGFGAGIEIAWEAGPIKLAAGARILVGLGTNPLLLKGLFEVWGTLDLVVVELDVSGELVCTVWDSGGVNVNLQGRFCGRVSFFFFSVEGCVGVEIGDSLTPAAPPPPAPVGKISLTDRRGYTTALATDGTPGAEHTVWPDTVPVVELTRHMAVALGGSAFSPGAPPAGPVWSGTSEMKYAYRLTGVDLVPEGGSPLAGPLTSGWWLPTHRPGVLADGDVAVSGEEGMFLALLAWDPAPWTYWLTDGGAGTDGDPAQTPGRLCDPRPVPVRACLRGQDAVRTGADTLRLPPDGAGSPPFPSRFEGFGTERVAGRRLGVAAPWLAERGLSLQPGRVDGAMWVLAAATRYGFVERTTELRAVLAPEVVAPELRLLVCTDLRERPTPERDETATECAVVGDHHRADAVLGRSTSVGPLKVSANGQEELFTRGDPVAIRVPEDGLTGHLPGPTDRVLVRLWFVDDADVKVVATDGQGNEVAGVGVDPGDGQDQTVELTGTGIAVVQVFAGEGVGLVSVCWGSTEEAGGGDESDLPRVLGTRATGGEEEWDPRVVEQHQLGSGTCRVVVYTPRSETAWRGVRVREWSGTTRQPPGRVGWISLCGVSGSAQADADANGAFADDLVDLVVAHSGPDVPARRDLLARGTTYAVRVRWQWQGWVRSEARPAPPAVPDPGAWQDGTEVVRRFRTAGPAAVTGSPPAELTDEKAFDPRSLVRYLLALEPDTGSAPHLLDDTLLVHLAVDHVDQLAGLYGREVGLRLRRTDPPPGSVAGLAHPLDVTLSVLWGPLFDDLRPLGQKRFLDAVREAPCLPEPALGGTTGEVTADLVPGAWYDLVLMATPTGDPDADDVVLRRAHFQASRYRDARELMAALGLTSGDPQPVIAPDAIAGAALPGGSLVVGDRELDQALAAAGLDPWPLPVAARTSVLWLRVGTSCRLAGVLLEAPEAIVRSGRRALDVTSCAYAGVALRQVRRNASGTRVLLAPSAPAAVGDGVLSLSLTRTLTDRTGAASSTVVSGARVALGVPRAVYQEAGA